MLCPRAAAAEAREQEREAAEQERQQELEVAVAVADEQQEQEGVAEVEEALGEAVEALPRYQPDLLQSPLVVVVEAVEALPRSQADLLHSPLVVEAAVEEAVEEAEVEALAHSQSDLLRVPHSELAVLLQVDWFRLLLRAWTALLQELVNRLGAATLHSDCSDLLPALDRLQAVNLRRELVNLLLLLNSDLTRSLVQASVAALAQAAALVQAAAPLQAFAFRGGPLL